MYNSYNLEAANGESLLKLFKNFLYAEKISKGSVRSYLSDIRFFLCWFETFLKENHLLTIDFLQSLSLITPKVLESYKASLLTQQTPLSTINRRFSSLRKFGNFCQSQGLLIYPEQDRGMSPFDALRNISEDDKKLSEQRYRLKEFRLYLWQNQASQSTIKNYLSDIRQFIQWSREQVIPLGQE
jgi:site-specific recombinase XerD